MGWAYENEFHRNKIYATLNLNGNCKQLGFEKGDFVEHLEVEEAIYLWGLWETRPGGGPTYGGEKMISVNAGRRRTQCT